MMMKSEQVVSRVRPSKRVEPTVSNSKMDSICGISSLSTCGGSDVDSWDEMTPAPHPVQPKENNEKRPLEVLLCDHVNKSSCQPSSKVATQPTFNKNCIELLHRVADMVMVKDSPTSDVRATTAAIGALLRQAFKGWQIAMGWCIKHGDCPPGWADSVVVLKDPVSQSSFVIDCNFRTKFEIVRPTNEFMRFLSTMIPSVFIGTTDSLILAVHCGCSAVHHALLDLDLVTPPWRKPQSLLSIYQRCAQCSTFASIHELLDSILMASKDDMVLIDGQKIAKLELVNRVCSYEDLQDITVSASRIVTAKLKLSSTPTSLLFEDLVDTSSFSSYLVMKAGLLGSNDQESPEVLHAESQDDVDYFQTVAPNDSPHTEAPTRSFLTAQLEILAEWETSQG